MITLKILFWATLLIVFYTYLGYGILLYLIIRLKRLFVGKPHEAAMPDDSQLPTITLLICAYNEEDVVAEKWPTHWPLTIHATNSILCG